MFKNYLFPLVLLNTASVTTDGVFKVGTLKLSDAIKIVNLHASSSPELIESAVSHPATAKIMEELLGVPVPVSRQMFEQKIGQLALCLKLNARPEPGKELSREELIDIGFSFKAIYREA